MVAEEEVVVVPEENQTHFEEPQSEFLETEEDEQVEDAGEALVEPLPVPELRRSGRSRRPPACLRSGDYSLDQ